MKSDVIWPSCNLTGDTYDPKQKISTWIITACRREVGKIEARRDSYTDATKGSDTEYETTHSGYKKKYYKTAHVKFR